jgi:hypothetical protein
MRLQLPRRIEPGRAIVADFADHAAAEKQRLHLVEPLGTRPEDAAESR